MTPDPYMEAEVSCHCSSSTPGAPFSLPPPTAAAPAPSTAPPWPGPEIQTEPFSHTGLTYFPPDNSGF